MAKQRRPQPKPTRTASKSATAPDNAPAAPPASTSRVPAPEHRPTYVEAVALYERGLQALQRHDYRSASDALQSVLRLYPEEKELHERVRLYLNVCARHATPQRRRPADARRTAVRVDARNQWRPVRPGHRHLRLVRDEDPDNDHALYMLAVAHAQRGELAEAMAHLERAIALNIENRALARTDPGSRAAARRRRFPPRRRTRRSRALASTVGVRFEHKTAR